jgi:hypothetical protein
MALTTTISSAPPRSNGAGIRRSKVTRGGAASATVEVRRSERKSAGPERMDFENLTPFSPGG